MEGTGAVVVGAGQAGLAVSQLLAQAGLPHLVLERGRIGESWRSQRWDSFALNTPTWANRLPGDRDEDLGEPADAFVGADVWADRLERYVARWALPVRERVAVTSIERVPAGDRWLVHVEGPVAGPLEVRSVVVASGIQNVPRVPPVAAGLPPSIVQLPALAYRRPADLPPGAVLVVGGGQTAVQVVEDLLAAGRAVYLSPSRVPRFRRRYRGREIFEWLVRIGFFEATPDSLPDPALLAMRQPVISGVGRYGHTVSLQWLASLGAVLVGRIRAVEGTTLLLDDTVGDCVRFGDEWSARMSRQVDEHIRATGSRLAPLEDDPADEPHPDPGSVRSPSRLDLRTGRITTVIWATGVKGDFGWLPPAALDDAGEPTHASGVSPLPGLFHLGLPWLTRRGSGIIHGVGGDAALIASHVVRRAEAAA